MKKSFTQSAKKVLVLALTICMVITASVVPVFADSSIGLDYSGKIVILHTNDVHGAIENYTYVAGLKKDLQAKGADVILVDAGDFSQGKTTVSLSKGASAVELMNLAGYDYATVGNHEFDYGYEQLVSNLADADFQLLCANIDYNGKNAFGDNAAYAIEEIDGVKIGLFGLDTPEAQTKCNPALIKGITVLSGTDIWTRATEQVAALQAADADVIICLSHLGVDNESDPYRSTDLVKAVSGIDMVIDGHSHTVMTQGPNGEAIQSTGTAVENIGMIVIDKTTKAIESNCLVPVWHTEKVDGNDVTVYDYTNKVKAVSDKADEIQAAIDEAYGVKFATSKVNLNGDKAPGNRNQETNNGDLITDAMVWYLTEKNPGSIEGVSEDNLVAVTNGGGIRAKIAKGDVTKNDIFSVLPFGNTLAVVYVTGAELLEALEASTYCTPDAVGGFPQIAGMDITIDTSKDYDAQDETYPASTYYGPKTINRVTINSVNGKAFDPTAKYAVATNNFCAAGGDTYYAFAAATSQFDTGAPLDEVVMAYITEGLGGVIGNEYTEPQGRIDVLPASNEYAGKLVILHTNDVHGAIDQYGYVRHLKEELEAKGADVILVDAGDFSQGKTTVSLSKGLSAIELMNLVGYDYATVGNHEFDYGLAQLQENLKSADFEVLCANILYNDANAFTPNKVVDKGGVKVGLFGLDTPEAQTKVNPALIQGMEVLTENTGLWDCAKEQVSELKGAGADVIICLAHLGVDSESAGHQSVDLAKNVEGIDMIIDGHSHTVMTEGPNGEAIQSTGTAVENIGMIVIDETTKEIVENKLVAPPAYGNKEVQDKADEIQKAIDDEYGVKFAESKVELNGAKAPNGNRDSETNNGDLITDAMVWYLTERTPGSIDGVDEANIVAITNGGGIRATIAKGDVTKNDILSVLPFGNTLAVVYVTGEELLEALEASTYCTPDAVGGFPQIAGMNVTLDTTKEFAPADLYPGSTYYAPEKIRRVTINSVNGKAFDPTAKYAVLTNNFCAAGGDTYYAFAAASSQFDTGAPLDEVVMAYITEKLGGVIGEEYAEPQGRMEIVTGETVHEFGEFVSDENATCTEDGTKTAKCLYCEETLTVVDEGSMLDHVDANLDGKCDVCGAAVEVEDDDNPETGDANDLAGLLFLLGAATVTGAACYKRKKAC